MLFGAFLLAMVKTKPAAVKAEKAVRSPSNNATKSSTALNTSLLKIRPHPAIAHMHAVKRNMKEKTGKSLDEWCKVVKREIKSKSSKDVVAHLTTKHGIGKTTSTVIASEVCGADASGFDPKNYDTSAISMAAALFEGKKAPLVPIANALLELVFGKAAMLSDIGTSPCSTMLPIYREHVIAQIKAPANSRVEFSFALRKAPAASLMFPQSEGGGATKSKKVKVTAAAGGPVGVQLVALQNGASDRLSHKVDLPLEGGMELLALESNRAALSHWLKCAYDADAPKK